MRFGIDTPFAALQTSLASLPHWLNCSSTNQSHRAGRSLRPDFNGPHVTSQPDRQRASCTLPITVQARPRQLRSISNRHYPRLSRAALLDLRQLWKRLLSRPRRRGASTTLDPTEVSRLSRVDASSASVTPPVRRTMSVPARTPRVLPSGVTSTLRRISLTQAFLGVSLEIVTIASRHIRPDLTTRSGDLPAVLRTCSASAPPQQSA